MLPEEKVVKDILDEKKIPYDFQSELTGVRPGIGVRVPFMLKGGAIVFDDIDTKEYTLLADAVKFIISLPRDEPGKIESYL